MEGVSPNQQVGGSVTVEDTEAKNHPRRLFHQPSAVIYECVTERGKYCKTVSGL